MGAEALQKHASHCTSGVVLGVPIMLLHIKLELPDLPPHTLRQVAIQHAGKSLAVHIQALLTRAGRRRKIRVGQCVLEWYRKWKLASLKLLGCQ